MVIQEAVEATQVKGRGWMPLPLRLSSKVRVTFMNCRSDQKKRDKETIHTHTHTQKFKMASLTKHLAKGKICFFPKFGFLIFSISESPVITLVFPQILFFKLSWSTTVQNKKMTKSTVDLSKHAPMRHHGQVQGLGWEH